MSLKIGIIGAGGMADHHINGFKSAGAEVVAIADPNEMAKARTCQKHGIQTSFKSASDMLKNQKDMDAVSIITPNKFHKDLAIAALDQKKHVFCEKPPALNAAETLAMQAAAKKSGRILMFDFNNRARPESYAMMEYVKSGAIGTINSAQASWIRRCGIPGFGGWFTNKKLSGGGPVIDLLHMIDLALYFMGYPEPAHVLARTFDDFIDNKNFKGPWGMPDVKDGVTDVETAAHALVTFKNGQVLTIRNSWAEMNKREEVSVVFQGQKAGGMVQRLFGIDGLDETSIDTCELYTTEHGLPVNRAIITKPDPTMGRTRAAANFVQAINKTEAPLNTPDEAVKLMKIIDAIYLSAFKNIPVAIK